MPGVTSVYINTEPTGLLLLCIILPFLPHIYCYALILEGIITLLINIIFFPVFKNLKYFSVIIFRI